MEMGQLTEEEILKDNRLLRELSEVALAWRGIRHRLLLDASPGQVDVE
jgi:hypothetical protein